MENLLSPNSSLSVSSAISLPDSSPIEKLLTEYRFLKSPLESSTYKSSRITGLTVEIGEVAIFRDRGFLFYFTDSMERFREILAALSVAWDLRTDLGIQAPFSCFEVVSDLFRNEKSASV
ncbi:hypothetical protein [Leptospira weilii]|uniref:Uncharacterized protein n=1 Tax=Leptospira weilii str. UI 13098 TaxID=1088542 RepID=M6Q2G2_9LEPT|nr:hypothetical protein [Leptospira weilii]EMN89474.1 hypothetical protein LEP1GSC108_0404 [Leptospira weilii str. UI 13098]